MPTAAVKLPAALEKFVASQVREGTYRSREAAIVAAVQHQKRRSEQQHLRVQLKTRINESERAGRLDEAMRLMVELQGLERAARGRRV